MIKSDEPHWYVAYVRSCCERKAAEVLARMGFEHYLPEQREVHQWSDRKKIVKRLVLPHMIFVRCLESRRLEPVRASVYFTRYMSARGAYNPVIIPDSQMDAFMKMVEGSSRRVDVMQDVHFVAGDKVRVTSGPLAGLECTLTDVHGTRCLAVGIEVLGTAIVELSSDAIEKIPD